MNKQLLEKISSLIMPDNDLHGSPASDKEIFDAELELGIIFDPQYIDFIKIFGGAFGGIEIHAFNNGELIGDETVTELTKSFRNAYSDNLTDELMQSCVISGDGAGNPILINQKGHIIIYLHETGEVEKMHNSLEELLQKSFP
ncbi:SMI1/KNR4 family protein [Pantoea sp. Tr-811]|uniref:SMI1/KNR4 family protein n=1 Tax=Pantoea sp. Tr-811 TaxID=2608361 RepID=UPI00142266DC|nr:SMI1/KNR4 family protein [Pantoea sp. Tr-811]NIF27158.1 SMI1/KNR4 family protein [Pantoea sp. Tr-811]